MARVCGDGDAELVGARARIRAEKRGDCGSAAVDSCISLWTFVLSQMPLFPHNGRIGSSMQAQVPGHKLSSMFLSINHSIVEREEGFTFVSPFSLALPFSLVFPHSPLLYKSRDSLSNMIARLWYWRLKRRAGGSL